jgi:hypothetical protein
MTYGDLHAKFDRLRPVFERVRFFHGRIGDSCNAQVPTGRPGEEPEHVGHFREMWTRCFQGFLAAAGPGDVVVFAPNCWPTT